MPDIKDKPRSRKWVMIRVGLYIIAYGVLMGLRNEFEQPWTRNVFVGCAGAVMGMLLYKSQKYWRQGK
jgi:hypothetical protein